MSLMILSRECVGVNDGARAMVELLRILRKDSLFSEPSPVDLPQNSILFESADPASPHGGKTILVPNPLFTIRARGEFFEAINLQPDRSHSWASFLRSAWEPLNLQESEDGCRFSGKIPSFNDSVEDDCDEIERLKCHPCLAPIELLLSNSSLEKKVRVEPTVGLYGMISYDLVSRFEMLPAPKSDPLNEWDFQFWLADQLIIIDHRKNAAWISVSAPHEASDPESVDSQVSLFNQLSQELNDLEATWKLALSATMQNKPAISETKSETDSSLPALASRKVLPITDQLAGFGLSMNDEFPRSAYEGLVREMKEKIHAGIVFQIVPSRSNTISPIGCPWSVYLELRKLNPSPYMFFIRDDRGSLLGASPETFLRIEASKSADSESRRWNVITCPIAGTRPRGLTPDGHLDEERDLRYEFELKSDGKELAEHSMLIDLARNDIAKVSVPGTRRVERPGVVEKFSHVQHLVSWVKGELDSLKFGPCQAYLAVANAGTLTGAPKIAAMKLLRQHEISARGYYGGSVGYFGFDGTCDLAIVIRSMRVQGETGVARAGAGIVADSIPAAEFDETERKLDAIRLALVRALATQANSLKAEVS